MTNSVTNASRKLNLGPLTALVVGSMIGGGIFSIPQNTAASAAAGATVLAWGITGLGMLALAFVFVNLTLRQPNLDSGVYAYARAAFGPFLGFSSAWGYWFMAVLGNVGYYVLLFSTLGHYLPVFGEGNTPVAVACASALLWGMHALVLRGIKEAAFINQLTTVAKLVPLLLFVVLVALAFQPGIFSQDIWGSATPELGTVSHQVRGMMLVTAWVFVGVEGASVYSARAARRAEVGTATLLGFLFTLALMVAVSLLSLGVMAQPELAKLKNPSMAHVLAHVVGPWGAALISVGLLVSLSGALLSWLLLSSETLFMAARDGSAPDWLAKENAHGVPVSAMWLTSGFVQTFLLITLMSSSTYLSLVNLGTSMILLPYMWAALFGLRLAWRGESYRSADRTLRMRDMAIAAVAVLYALWLLYAGGMKYLLLSALLYTPGALLYAWTRRSQGTALFTRGEWPVFLMVLAAAIVAALGLRQGWLHL
ncbi:arginine-ornithine antiporter [Ottowia thiooxydans]|uniref:arginine-ornithine antiporter n=1 Tax=Ottowia thiooxydans TaxID=219182 RepID=UPI00048C8D53|nr:arginine-ornithine antiporter [Ottowia thiooxydans]